MKLGRIFDAIESSPEQNIWQTVKGFIKLDQTRKFWYLLLYNFWLLDTKTHLCWKEWELDCIPKQFWYFPHFFVSYYPKSWVVQHLVRELTNYVFNTRYQVPFCFWRIKAKPKHSKLPKYEYDNFVLQFYVSNNNLNLWMWPFFD